MLERCYSRTGTTIVHHRPCLHITISIIFLACKSEEPFIYLVSTILSSNFSTLYGIFILPSFECSQMLVCEPRQPSEVIRSKFVEIYRSLVFCGSIFHSTSACTHFATRVVRVRFGHLFGCSSSCAFHCSLTPFLSISSLDRVHGEYAFDTATSDHSGALPDEFASPLRRCANDDDDCDGDHRARRRREEQDSSKQEEIPSDQQDQEQSLALQSLQPASPLPATAQEARLKPPTSPKQPAPPIFDLVINIDDLDVLDP